MTTYVLREDADGNFHLVEKHLAPLRESRAFAVVGDGMDPAVHPANGKVYDSKSRFRAESRARGLEEIGNEYRALTERPRHERPPVEPDVARVYDEVMSRRR